MQCADVEFLVRMVTGADGHDVVQTGGAEPLADTVLTPARDATVGAHGTGATPGGGDETVAAPRRAAHESGAASNRCPVGRGRTGLRVRER